MKSFRRIAICGGGNAAHVLMARLSEDHHVSVYAPFADEADKLVAGMSKHGGVQVVEDGRIRCGRPAIVSADPADVFTGADLVLLALPASAHANTLSNIAPFLRSGAWVVALPARGGFDWEARTILPEGVVLAGLQTLPWACRIRPGAYGRTVDVLGTKHVVDLATAPVSASEEGAETLQNLLGVSLQPIDSFLALTLANTGQLIHPGIMYGLFHDWDGTPLGEDETPLFYNGVTPVIADQLQAMSDEVQAICQALAAYGVELQSVLPLAQWLNRAYPHDISDATDLHSSFQTNRAYAGLRAPMQLSENNSLVPWFESRYLTEDVPYGLLVTRGVAELCEVPTPTIDCVIDWAQIVLGKGWLRQNKVQGADVQASRAPQRFAISDLTDLYRLVANNS